MRKGNNKGKCNGPLFQRLMSLCTRCRMILALHMLKWFWIDLVPIVFHLWFVIRPKEIGKTLLVQKTCVSDAIHLWNSAPSSITNSITLSQAKTEIKKYVKLMPIWSLADNKFSIYRAKTQGPKNKRTTILTTKITILLNVNAL